MALLPDEEQAALKAWRKAGPPLIAEHDEEFGALLASTRRALARRRFAQAAAEAQAAANHAVLWHTGRFCSPELESIIEELGKAAIPFSSAPVPGQTAGGLCCIWQRA